MSDAPIGVLAEGAGGLALARVIMRRLPAEDVVVLSDNAYAPYARRSARVVLDRAPRMAGELQGDGIKLLVVASLQAGEDALEAVAAAAGVPTIALDATLVHAAARARGGRIAAIWADGTLRAQPWVKAHRFERGGVEVVPLPWPGLAQAIEAGRAPDLVGRPDVPADCTVALVCPYAAMAAELFVDPVDCAAITADRVHRQLMRMGALARRRRPGRLVLRSSHPVRAQASLRTSHAGRSS